MMKIAFFDTKPYDKESFLKFADRAQFKFFETKLNEDTVDLAHGFDAVCAGRRDDPEMIAHNLFRILRDSDHDGVDVLLSETFGETELGQAIMNRLLKAAGYHVISAEPEASYDKN